MPIIGLVGALIMGGAVIAALKNRLKGHGDRVNSLHMN